MMSTRFPRRLDFGYAGFGQSTIIRAWPESTESGRLDAGNNRPKADLHHLAIEGLKGSTKQTPGLIRFTEKAGVPG